MKIGPDGSLCRITSTLTETNNIIIKKLDISELSNPLIQAYKPLIIGGQVESSEDEKSDDDVAKDKIPTDLNCEENKTIHSDSTHVNDDKKSISPKGNKNPRQTQVSSVNYGRSKSQHRGHNYNRMARKRIYNSSNNMSKTFKKTPTSTDIKPWLSPPINTYNHFPGYNLYPGPTLIDTVVTPNLNLEANLAMKSGLLGDSPYSPVPQQFHQVNQSAIPISSYWGENLVEHIGIRDQNYWKGKPAAQQSAIHEQSYWDDEIVDNYWIEGHPDSYPRPVSSERKIPMKATHNKNYRNRRYRNWGNKGRNNSSARWNRNQSNEQKEGMNTNLHYSFGY